MGHSALQIPLQELWILDAKSYILTINTTLIAQVYIRKGKYYYPCKNNMQQINKEEETKNGL